MDGEWRINKYMNEQIKKKLQNSRRIVTHLQLNFVSVTENFLKHIVQPPLDELGCKGRRIK